MEMHQVRYFLAVAAAKNFTRAAEVCHVSQPALTAAIKRLEGQLGSPLFHREAHQVLLTEFGRRMQPHFSRISEQAKAAETVAKDFRLLNQVPVRVGVMSTIGPMRIAALIASFEQGSPGVTAAVRDGSPEALAAQLEADELDLAILNPLYGLGDNYHAEPLYTERYVIMLPPEHPLRAQNTLTLRDLSEQPYVDRLSCEMREMFMSICNKTGVKLYARLRSERQDWVQAMVMTGIGFAFMPEYSVSHPDSIWRPLVDPPVSRTVSLITMPGRKYTPPVAAFIRAVRTYKWN